MRPASLALAVAIAAAAGALALAATVTGGGSAPPASSLGASFGAAEMLRGDELVRVPASRAGAAGIVASRKSAKLSYHTTVNFETVVAGGDQLYEIRCPQKRQPLTGGVFSATPGLAVVNSSRISPDPDRPTLSGAWYEGVVNLTGTALQWKPLLVCVRS